MNKLNIIFSKKYNYNGITWKDILNLEEAGIISQDEIYNFKDLVLSIILTEKSLKLVNLFYDFFTNQINSRNLIAKIKKLGYITVDIETFFDYFEEKAKEL